MSKPSWDAFRRSAVRMAKKGASDAARVLAREAGLSAPRGETGELAAAVQARPPRVRGDRVSAAVEDASDHAAAVEFGTEHMAAQPFFRPAIRRARPAMIAAVRSAMSKTAPE